MNNADRLASLGPLDAADSASGRALRRPLLLVPAILWPSAWGNAGAHHSSAVHSDSISPRLFRGWVVSSHVIGKVLYCCHHRKQFKYVDFMPDNIEIGIAGNYIYFWSTLKWA